MKMLTISFVNIVKIDVIALDNITYILLHVDPLPGNELTDTFQ
jgi:hypothetical protein